MDTMDDSTRLELQELHEKGLLTEEELRTAINSLRSKTDAIALHVNRTRNIYSKRNLSIIACTLLATSFLIWFLFFGTKSNYLITGKSATITTKAGIYLRTEPNNSTGRSIGLIPYHSNFEVIEEGAEQTLYRIRSRWYLVRYQGKVGWAWGGFARQE
jgi:hypothetical protein